MKLNMGIICDELTIYRPQLDGDCAYELDIATAVLLDERVADYRDDCLYLLDRGNRSLLGRLPQGSHLLCIGLDSTDIHAAGFSSFLSLPGDVTIGEMLFALQGIFRKYNDWYQRILGSIAAHEPLDVILRQCAVVLQNPIELVDASFSYLAHAGALSDDVAGTVWEVIFKQGFTPTDIVREEYPERVEKTLYGRHEMLVMPSNRMFTGHSTTALLPLTHEGKIVAFLAAVDNNTPFTNGQLSLFQHMKSILELALLNNHELLDANNNATRLLLLLFQGKKVDPKSLSYYLVTRNWKATDWFRVLLFDFRDEQLVQQISHVPYVLQINNLLGDAIVIPDEGRIVALQHRKSPEEASDTEQLETLLERFDMSCGVSLVCEGVEHFGDAYQQAALALDESNPRVGHRRVSEFAQNYSGILLSLLGREIDLQTLCQPLLLRLLDTKDPVLYARCLRSYLANGFNIAATADELYMHRNSLKFRIARIEELLGVNLKQLSREEQLLLSVSTMVLERNLSAGSSTISGDND